MELYLKVRLACADGMSQRAAARHFNVSRDTVRKMLSYSSPPGYRRTAVVRRPKLEGFVTIIEGWLDGDRSVPRKQRHTAKRLYDRLRTEHGFTGGYTIIKDYIREREQRSREVFDLFDTAPLGSIVSFADGQPRPPGTVRISVCGRA